MEARELKNTEVRVLNLVQNASGGYQFEVTPEMILEPYGLYPIPLTEEWLLKFGFQEKDRRQNRFIKNDDFELEFQGDKVAYCVWGGEDAPHLTQFFGHCKHVHQLQNLYFALTGEELEITKTK
jgi:hypothetical protein